MARTDRELTEEQWARLAPLLPPQRPPMGRPPKDHRLLVEGMVWTLRTGTPWRICPARMGPGSPWRAASPTGAARVSGRRCCWASRPRGCAGRVGLAAAVPGRQRGRRPPARRRRASPAEHGGWKKGSSTNQTKRSDAPAAAGRPGCGTRMRTAGRRLASVQPACAAGGTVRAACGHRRGCATDQPADGLARRAQRGQDRTKVAE